MTNEFIDAITTTLYQHFGESYTYYVEDIEQNFKKPCFMVNTLNPSIRSTGIRSYHRVIPIVIHYFTDKDNTSSAKKDCYLVAEDILESLEYLTVNNKLFRGEDISWELVEGVLQFFITYRLDAIREIEEVLIEEGTLNDVSIEKG